MKNVQLFKLSMGVLLLLLTTGLFAQDTTDPNDLLDHVVVKGSSTKGKGNDPCIESQQGFFELEYVVTIANLEEHPFFPGQFRIPLACPELFMQLWINGNLIDQIGPLTDFTDDLIEVYEAHYHSGENPLYQQIIAFNIPISTICTEENPDDYTVVQEITTKMVTMIGGEYVPYATTINEYATAFPFNPFEGCSVDYLFPEDDFRHESTEDEIVETIRFCCEGALGEDPDAPFGGVDPDNPFAPDDEYAGGRNALEQDNVNESLITDIQVMPNPFDQYFSLQYELNTNTEVVFELIDLQGQLIRRIEDQQSKGSQNWSIDMNDLPAGIYIGHLQTDHQAHTFRLIKQ
ncbi:MAG: T9SS type A sorting domain-containing protein [Bacteroidota bacterium]